MLKVLLLSVALSIPTGVNAFDLCADSDPPDRYEYIPDKPVTLHVVDDMNIVRDACDIGMDYNAWGCTVIYPNGTNEIFIMDTGDITTMNCILLHEYAHVNGWSANHED